MRGLDRLRWAGLLALVFLLAPATGVALAQETKFIAPVSGEIVRRFDPPTQRFGAGHRGIDYGVTSGTPVRASGSGTVSFAGPVAGDGYFVTIEHGGGLETTYSFLSQVQVTTGSAVHQGDVIALTGGGHRGGPNALHFGAKQGGRYIDPTLLLGEFDDITDLLSLTQAGANSTPRNGSRSAAVSPRLANEPAIGTVTAAGPVPNQVRLAVPDAGMLDLSSEAERFVRPPRSVGSGSTHQETAHDAPLIESPSNVERATPTPKGASGTSDTAWWNSLPDDFRQELLAEDPERWENFEGLSARDRDAINRRLLDEKIEELEAYRRSEAGQRELRN